MTEDNTFFIMLKNSQSQLLWSYNKQLNIDLIQHFNLLTRPCKSFKLLLDIKPIFL